MYCIIVLLRTLRTAFWLNHSNLWNLDMLDPEGERPFVFLYSTFQLLKCIQICSCQVSGHWFSFLLGNSCSARSSEIFLSRWHWQCNKRLHYWWNKALDSSKKVINPPPPISVKIYKLSAEEIGGNKCGTHLESNHTNLNFPIHPLLYKNFLSLLVK